MKRIVTKDIKNVREVSNSIEEKKKENSSRKSYAEATGEIVIIKPKMKQDSEKTKETVQKSLNPSELEIGIKQVKATKEGGILIKCSTVDEVEKMKTAAEKKLNQDYYVKIPSRKNPSLKIIGIDENYNK